MYKGSNLQPNEKLQIGSASISASYNSRCLGVTWSYVLSPKESVDFDIKKALKPSLHLACWVLIRVRTHSLPVKCMRCCVLYLSISMVQRTGC